MVATRTGEPRKKDVLLAFIMERLVQSGRPPSLDEMAKALAVSKQRVRDLRAQLVVDGRLRHTPGAQRDLIVVDVAGNRSTLTTVLERLGWGVNSQALPARLRPLPQDNLPRLPAIEHLSDLAWPGEQPS